jgi:hypothetical protein
MRVLVLSHTRCGSTTLCKWLSNELDIVLDERPYDFKTFNSIVKSNNVLTKIVVEEYYPTKEEINKFDKVICLTRENSTEASISFIQCKNVDMWHNQYEITTEWIGENKNKILEQIYKYDEMKLRLKEYDVFQTTYENIYISKTDVNKILNYMNIDSPKHLDMLNYGKKYRKDNNIFIKKHNGII